MRTVGVLTYHHVANWGSALQTWASCQLLNRLLPTSKIEVVDYVPLTSARYTDQRLYPSRFRRLFRRPAVPFDRVRAACNRFVADSCPVSAERLVSDSVVLGERFLEKQKYDTVVVGSDTVLQFGPAPSGRRVAAPPAPNLYHLPFAASFSKLALAASADPVNIDLYSMPLRERMGEALSDFEVITYRDGATRELLRAVGVADAKVSFIPDPTLLVDLTPLLPEHHCDPMQRRAGVAIAHGELAAATCEVVRLAGFTPVNLLREATPTTMAGFLALHRNLDLMITDRFHGSIVALLVARCPMIALEDARRYPHANSKLRDLFRRLALDQAVHRHSGTALTLRDLQLYLDGWDLSPSNLSARLTALRESVEDNVRAFATAVMRNRTTNEHPQRGPA